jgi:hypothetical protein
MGGIKGCIWHPGNEQACGASRFLTVLAASMRNDNHPSAMAEVKTHSDLPNICIAYSP